jgi:outer membrane lipopolysaccharide assembly protein LptE/RlpB
VTGIQRRLFLLSSAALFLAACGYNLAGRGTFLPERIKVLGIPPFDSAIPRATVSEKLTAAVTREFVSRGRYKVVPGTGGADAVLTGNVTGFLTTPIAFDDQGRATRAVLTVTAGVTLRDVREGQVLYENPAFQFRSELELGENTQDFYDPESEAVDEIARNFARSLVATMSEGF